MKLISVITPCYNEEGNVEEVYRRVKDVLAQLPQYRYEHIFIDNASRDRTVPILKEIAQRDRNVKIIVNSRNFGPVRSPHHGLLQAKGDACISVVADLQDPPEMILDFVRKWEEGYKRVLAVKKGTKESFPMSFLRKVYYYIISGLSETEQLRNSTGFGLYDKVIVDVMRKIDDPYPYFRGLLTEIGFDLATVEYVQPVRKRGKTKQSFYSLFDLAMLGITSHSKVPLRLATMLGFLAAACSFLCAVLYFVYKLIFWDSFTVGMAPMVIGIFFFSAVQLFFIGIIGEYIGSIHTQVMNRPLVVEKERINFDEP